MWAGLVPTGDIYFGKPTPSSVGRVGNYYVAHFYFQRYMLQDEFSALSLYFQGYRNYFPGEREWGCRN